ncbi:MAG: YidC/Oxa1 family membrane protein insertase [Lachnospiraceae bacterium]|nr:YidC/Oxa1 family membrane protein insertase [Lachnospiraceae bacterium]
MSGILLTTYQGKILGPIAKFILGPIINAIFIFLDKILGSFDKGLIGLAIILFTLVIYLCLTPLTIKQQKFSKLSAKMNPELQAVQARYKGKQDNESMMAMNQETKAVYAKYGVSPSGSCVQLLIQMPILFALYRVIYSMPAYIATLKTQFEVVARSVIANGLVEEIKTIKSAAPYLKNFDIEGNELNAVIDVLNSMNEADLTKYAGTASDSLSALAKIKEYNYFLGMNLSNSPSNIIASAWNNADGKQWGLIIAAVMIPLLAAATQWINTKLMPQQSDNSNQSDSQSSMQQSMKMMNTFMPIMSAVFCFSFSTGIGIYWIAGAVIRSIQQIVINKQIDKIDVDELVKKNEEKRKEKLIKKGIDPSKVNSYATMNTKNIAAPSKPSGQKRSMSEKASVKPVSGKAQDKALEDAMESSSGTQKKYKPGSIAAKANMVRDYNENNNQ